MSTLKTVLAVVAALVAGFAIATWLSGGDSELTDALPAASGGETRGAVMPAPRAGGTDLAERLARVEAELKAELEHRAELEARIEELDAEIGALALAAARGGAAPSAPPQGGDSQGAARGAARARAAARGENAPPLAERLVAAGFSTDRAAWIERRVAELPMEVLRAQYEARRSGEPPGPAMFGVDQALRAELGDAEYERYLEAVGRPTSVAVGSVLASSPAEQAGLVPGDQIVAYDGRRVFDMRDLNRLTLEGQAGEPVLVDVLRDGQRIQIVVPRGPVGVAAGRRRR